MQSKQIQQPHSTGKTPQDDLWDNDMVQSIKQQLTPADTERYKRLGQEMYDTIDFESIDDSNAFLKDTATYLVASLRSGLRVEQLEEDEKQVMKTCFGDDWDQEWLRINSFTPDTLSS